MTTRAHDALLPIGVGLDQADVDREALYNTPGEDDLDQTAQQVAVAEATMAVFGEGGVVRHPAGEPEPAEPAVGEVEVDFVAQPALGADAEAVADEQHADHRLGVDRGRPVEA